MTITPIGPASAEGAQLVPAKSTQGDVSVRFAPGETGGPLDRVGSSVVTGLKNFEASRSAKAQAMSSINAGPASAIDAEKARLVSGPASASGTHASAPAGGAGEDRRVDHALTAMTRSFDYAIETQLIVKTGSQLSTSASSLMRGQ